jgi:hypothetical protein
LEGLPPTWVSWESADLYISKASVATVMTDVFQKNEINLLRKFARIMIIFDKIDDLKNQGVIQWHQSFVDIIIGLLKDD